MVQEEEVKKQRRRMKVRWNTKESEKGGEETIMTVINRGEWEELVKEFRDMKGEIKGWR